MDNRNVHIDELFQQRFENESDREYIHQSWKKMEQLLDGEKEKRRVVFWKGFNWLIPGFLITLIAAISAGYWWNKNQAADDTLIASQDHVSSSDPTGHMGSFPNGHQDQQSVTTPEADRVSGVPQATAGSNTIAGTSQSYTTAQNRDPELSGQTPAAPKKKSLSSSPVTKKQSGVSEKKTNGHPIVIDDKGQVYAGSPTQIGAKIMSDRKVSSAEEQEIIQQLEEAIEHKALVVDKTDKTIKKVETVQVKGPEINQKMIKDNDVRNKMIVLHDTIGFKEVSKISYIPLSVEEIRALQGLALTQNPEEGQYDLVKIERFHHAPDQDPPQLLSAADKSAGSNIQKSEDAKKNSILKDVNNFFEIKNKFYTTVFGGLNVSTNTFFPIGFQGGVGLHYWLGSRWSVGAELGYSYRPMEYTFTDESVTNTQNGPGIPVSSGMMYNYKEDKNSNVYNFKYLNTVEMPLLFTYHGDKWSFFGGPSLNFASKLRYQKLSSFSSSDKMVVLKDAESFGDAMKNTNLQSQSNDFDPRIGVGLNLGARYALTDRLGLTATYSQVLYDNAKTNLGQQFSKEMLRVPSLRIGITYRLNNDKKVKYMMDK